MERHRIEKMKTETYKRYFMENILYGAFQCVIIYAWWILTLLFLSEYNMVTIIVLLFNMIIKGLIPQVIIIVILSVCKKNIYENVFAVYETENGLHRKNIFIYGGFYKIFNHILTLCLLYQIYFQFGELKKTTIVFSLYSIYSILRDLLSLKCREKEDWFEEYKEIKKPIFPYISKADNGTYCIPDSAIDDKWIEKKQLDIKKRKFAGRDVYETEFAILCPFWLYKELINKIDISQDERLLILDDSIRSYQNKVLKLVLEECSRKEKYIFQLIFKIDKNRYYPYRYDYPINIVKDTNQIIDILTKGNIKQEIPYFQIDKLYHEYFANIEQVIKYQFIDEQLNTLAKKQNESATEFYRLFKILEYVLHYRALYKLATDKELSDNFFEKSVESSMGLWNRLQYSPNMFYRNKECVEAYRMVKKVLTGKECGKSKISYSDICDLLTQLRNRYIGHGTMAFSISDELLISVKILVHEIIKIFYEDEKFISKTMCFDNGAYILKVEQTEVSMLIGYISGTEAVFEYLDYMHGIISANQDITFRMDYKE